MTHPLRASVGAAVLAGALVFCGTTAPAQGAAAEGPVQTEPAEPGAGVAVEPSPAADEARDPGVSEMPEADDTRGAGEAAAGESDSLPPGDGSVADAAVSGEQPPAAIEEEPVAASGPGEPVNFVSPPEALDEPEEASAATAVEEQPTRTTDAIPVVRAEVPVGLPDAGPASRPASGLAGVPVPVSDPGPVPDVEIEVAAAEEAGSDRVTSSSVPGSDLIKFPEGAAGWTEAEWFEWLNGGESATWLDENAETLQQVMDTDEFLAFLDAVAPYLLDDDMNGLLAYLNEQYPDDPVTAQFMTGIVLGLLIDEGLLDIDGTLINPAVPDAENDASAEEPVEKPVEAPVEKPVEVAVAPPVVNNTTERAPAVKPAAKIKPIKVPVAVRTELAQAGISGAGLIAGAGGGLLLAGVGTLMLRRRWRA